MRLSDPRVLAFRADAQSQHRAIADIVWRDQPVLRLQAAAIAFAQGLVLLPENVFLVLPNDGLDRSAQPHLTVL